MQFTDSHCHLDFIEFADNFPQLLSQCATQHINRLIVPAVNPEDWSRLLSLPKQNNQPSVVINTCLGIHPWFLIVTNNAPPQQLDLTFQSQQLTNAVAENRQHIIAIGECGIDVFKAKKNTANEQALAQNIKHQEDFFAMQLSLAKTNNLPVIVHHCQSHHLIVAQLKTQQLPKAGVIHAFSGSYQQAKAYVDLGFKLGIGGTITYPRAQKTLDAIKRLPLSSLLLETDAPAMPVFGQQGMVNSPLNLKAVFQALSKLRPESEEVIAEQIESNVKQLFFSATPTTP